MRRNRLSLLAALATLTGCQLVGYNAFDAVELTDASQPSTVGEDDGGEGLSDGEEGEDAAPTAVEVDAQVARDAALRLPAEPRDAGSMRPTIPPFDTPLRDAGIFRRDGSVRRRDARVDERPDATVDAGELRDATTPGGPMGPGGPGGARDGGEGERECVGEERCALQCGRRTDEVCELGCSESGECDLGCGGNRDCAVLCDRTRECRPVCGPSSFCLISCLDTQRCRPRCESGSTCGIDCEGSNCRDVECAPGARCFLRCRNSPECSFASCSGEVEQCAQRVLACGARCPEEQRPPDDRPDNPGP